MLFLFILLFFGYLDVNVKGEATRTIPDLLRPCYLSNYDEAAKPPLSLPLMIELIRKIELSPSNSFNMRILSSALLHGVLFDGVRRQYGLDDSYIQYSATGSEYHKYKLIADNLVEDTVFPNDTLKLDELCFLHKLISNTIDPLEAQSTCAIHRPMPLESFDTDTGTPYCQPKKGTIQTNWGPITASQLVMGIAYGLQQSDVTFRRLQQNFRLKQRLQLENNSNVTLWVATIASDLSEIVLQLNTNPIIGSEGIWNDTSLPRAYYLNTNATLLTEDEILGGIDATILGLNVKEWTTKMNNLRFSQLLDMYYSARGIAFKKQVKAASRSTIFKYLHEQVNLVDQVSGSFSLLLGMGAELNGSPTEEDVNNLSQIAVEKFSSKADEVLKKYNNIESGTYKFGNVPLEVLIVLDDSYDSYHYQRLLNSLAESLQMSYYGTRIGIINGETGNWISNVTTEIYDLFKGLHQNQDSWPATLNIDKTFKAIISFYQNKTNVNCSHATKPLAKSIIIFSRSGRVTDLEKTVAQNSVNSVKDAFPETNIIYVTNDENNFFKDLSQKFNNDSVIGYSTEVSQVVTKIFDKLKEVPASIVYYYCDNNKLRFEDYVTPGVESIYEIHEEYIRRTHFNTKFKNHNYGDIKVCASGTANEGNRICQSIEKNGEYRFNSTNYCTEDARCNMKFFVFSNSTATNCLENDCRYPDQVRIEITYSYSGATWFYPVTLLLLCTLFVNLI